MLLEPDEIRRARERLGYSQSDLAEALHMGPNGATRVREWEQGKRDITGPASVAIRLMLGEELEAAFREGWIDGYHNGRGCSVIDPGPDWLESDARQSGHRPNPVSASS